MNAFPVRPRRLSPLVAFCALLSALCALPAPAADKKKTGSSKKEEAAPGNLLYANTVAEKGWSFFVLDGEDIRPAGIEPGFCSGWVSYPAGPRQLQFEHQPLGLVDLEADLQPGALHAFIAYSDSVPQTERGRPPRPVLAVKELRCDRLIPADKRRANSLVLLNVTAHPELRVRFNDEVHEITRLKETLLKVPKRGGMLELAVLSSDAAPGSADAVPDAASPDTAAAAQEPLCRLELAFEDPGARFVVFYSDAQGGVQHLRFDDIGMYPEEAAKPAEER